VILLLSVERPSGTSLMPANPSQPQILTCIGNRYVVFGPEATLPAQLQFNPETDTGALPRIADDDERLDSRILSTLRVQGMTVSPVLDERRSIADFELIDPDGRHILVEMKIRDSDPKRRDVELSEKHIQEAAAKGDTLEVWYLNTDRLRLLRTRRPDQKFPPWMYDELVPLDVWEINEGEIFGRAKVVAEVNDWIQRIDAFYADIASWLTDRTDLKCERVRTVVMAEEMMQQFAVPDRELPVLDLVKDDQAVASFVPRGLWLIGVWGRIDMITSRTTQPILAIKHKDGSLQWSYSVTSPDRRLEKFDKTAFLEFLGQT